MRRFLLIAIALGISTVLLWAVLLRPPPCEAPPPSEKPLVWVANPTDTGSRSLVGIQPLINPFDYQCEERFRKKLTEYLEAAKPYLRPGSIVVWPEYIGTWLLLMDEPWIGFSAKTLEGAQAWFVLAKPWAFWKARKQASGWKDPNVVAVLQLKAEAMARAYHRAFSQLARQYGVTMVAGSIALPGAQIVGDSLIVQVGAPVQNVSVTYDPQGRPIGITRKVFPIAEELAFTQAAPLDSLRPIVSGSDTIGVLICADSWYPETYARLRGAHFWVVPSYLMGDSCWNKPWTGYSGFPAPADVHQTNLKAGEAWLTYAMGGRLPKIDTQAVGLNVFIRGQLWDLGVDGRAIIVYKGQTLTAPAEAGVVVIWLQEKVL